MCLPCLCCLDEIPGDYLGNFHPITITAALCTCAKLSLHPLPLTPLPEHHHHCFPSRKHHFCCSPPALLKKGEFPSPLPVLVRNLVPQSSPATLNIFPRMLVITWFEEVAALNQSVPWVKFSQVLRATQQRTQLLTSHSYTGNNIQSPLWAWKISTRDTEGKELTGIAWHCLWYPFLGDFCTHHLLKRWRHLALTTTTTPSRVHFFCFFSNSPVFPVLRKGRRGDPSWVCSQEFNPGDGVWNKAEYKFQTPH